MAKTDPPRPLIVPIFIPHAGCPHRCAFCDQTAITGRHALPAAEDVVAAVTRWRARSRRIDRPLQVAFYGGNFLGLARDNARSLLTAAAEAVSRYPSSGIRFSTRPDSLTPESLATLAGFPVQLVELGVQSFDDRVLSAAHRGHDARSAVTAIHRLKSAGIAVGVQLMVGLPEDTPVLSMASARRAAALKPDAVRIYPTIVLKNSRLAEWMKTGTYRPWALTDAVAVTAGMLRIFATNGIPVIRMGLQADDGLTGTDTVLAGPYHPAFGDLVHSYLFRAAMRREFRRCAPRSGEAVVGVHPRSRSRAGGWRNATIRELERRHSVSLRFVDDAALNTDQLWVDHRPPISVFSA
jgi:histone acetyltransferase (RNA polymerase elongator complex component)